MLLMQLLPRLPADPLPRYLSTTGQARWSRAPKGARGKSELHRVDCQVTPGRRKATDRATEKRPPTARWVRVKRWGKSPPRHW
jgi:hypothetical protein